MTWEPCGGNVRGLGLVVYDVTYLVTFLGKLWLGDFYDSSFEFRFLNFDFCVDLKLCNNPVILGGK